MSVKTKEEILTSLKTIIGDTPSDEAIALLEDVSDTLDKSTGGSSEEDKKRIEELEKQVKETDTMWRQKYADRFLNPTNENGNENNVNDNTEDDIEEDNTPKTFNDLFSQE